MKGHYEREQSGRSLLDSSRLQVSAPLGELTPGVL